MIMLSKVFRHRHKHISEAFESSEDLLQHRGRSAEVSELSLVPATLVRDRQRVLIATVEYDIEDWAIKVKIGGLGVMAQLMGKSRKSTRFQNHTYFGIKNEVLIYTQLAIRISSGSFLLLEASSIQKTNLRIQWT